MCVCDDNVMTILGHKQRLILEIIKKDGYITAAKVCKLYYNNIHLTTSVLKTLEFMELIKLTDDAKYIKGKKFYQIMSSSCHGKSYQYNTTQYKPHQIKTKHDKP